MKKTNFPSSMIVVAAVVSFGMVGSQLDLGGLSGQAAGGEAAGCGGDAYYDEDLGALVDSQGNVLDENGEVAQAGSEGGEAHHMPYDAHVAGEAMQGQNLVTIIRPVGGAIDALAEASGGETSFQPRAHVAPDGSYAIISYDAENYEDLNQVQLLKNERGTWTTVLTITSEREDLPVSSPTIDYVEAGDEGDIVRFTMGFRDFYEYDLAAQTIRLVSSDEMNELAEIRMEQLGIEDQQQYFFREMADFALVDFVQTRVQHPWLVSFVEETYGPDITFALNTSMNNQMLVSLSNGEVLAIQGCEFGNTPINAGGELVCTSCEEAGGCDNVFNRADLISQSFDERQEYSIAVNNELIALNRLVPRTELSTVLNGDLFKANGYSHTWADEAQNKVYSNSNDAGNGDAWGTYGDSCRFVIRGSANLANWFYNAMSFVNDWLAWGLSGDNIANSIGHSRIRNCASSGRLAWTGHSRGGAVAAYLKATWGGQLKTFAAPRWTDNSGRKITGKRFYHEDDIVTSIGSGHHNTRVVVKSKTWCASRHWWGGCKSYESGSERRGDYSNDGGSFHLWFNSNSYSAHVDYYDDAHRWD